MIIATATNGCMEVKQESSFYSQIKEHVKGHRYLLETGTYLGLGTTKAIIEGMDKDAHFFSIEGNKDNHAQAINNVRGYAPWYGYQNLLQGCSLPIDLLPTPIETIEYIEECRAMDVYVDHQEHNRVDLYMQECGYVKDPTGYDYIGRVFDRCKPTFILLDSAGHVGHIEFNYVLSMITYPITIALDDTNHIKHCKSLAMMRSNRHFDILAEGNEKFGYAIARYTP